MPVTLKKYLVLIMIILASCNKRPGGGINQGSLKTAPETSYAQRFHIEKKDRYSVLTIINPWQGAKGINHTYYLIKKGEKIPAGIDTSAIIYVPVERIICMSTTYIAMITALGAEQSVKGISGADLVFDKKLKEKVRRREVEDVGYEDNLNKELVIQIAPELIMVYGVGSEASGYLNKIRELGYRILFNADYLETDPLGKAEWIKVFGALFCKEKKAEEIFFSISREYDEVKSLIKERSFSRPSVLLGLPWKDTWFISPGNSFISTLISDAGGNYLWKDTRSDISMPFGIENVYMKALEADFWLNTGSTKTMREITAVDIRLGDLPPFRTGNIYNNINRVTESGGNDYWESGAIKPQIILKDIAAILHPELFPGYQLYYYKKIN